MSTKLQASTLKKAHKAFKKLSKLQTEFIPDYADFADGLNPAESEDFIFFCWHDGDTSPTNADIDKFAYLAKALGYELVDFDTQEGSIWFKV